MREVLKKYPLLFVKDSTENDEQLNQHYQEAWQEAKRAAALLKKNYKAEKVLVFGSLTNRFRFNRWSDIDLAAVGIPDKDFYAAVGALIGIITKFKIDLVDLEDCKRILKNTIEDEGVEI